MSKEGNIIADSSIVTHTDGSQHLWRKRGACVLCQDPPTDPKEPPPPAATENIADIEVKLFSHGELTDGD